MNNVIKKGILLAAGLLLAGCGGDNYWFSNDSNGDTQVNGNTVKAGRCIELEDSFWGSDFDEKVSVGGTAYELDPGHHIWSGSGTPAQVTDEKEIEALDEKCKAEPQPAGTPPAGTPPAGTPPAGTPPAGTPPAEQPPAGTPPAEQPPAGTPPAGTPPAGTPPAGTPPAGTPPVAAECTANKVTYRLVCTKQRQDSRYGTVIDTKSYLIIAVRNGDVLSDAEKQACLQKYGLNAVFNIYDEQKGTVPCSGTGIECLADQTLIQKGLEGFGYTCNLDF